MPDLKTLIRASIQCPHDLIEIPCKQLECELLKDDLCE